MRKHIALMATVAALAVTPALAQTTTPNKDSQTAPQAQPSTQAPSDMNKSMDAKPMDRAKSTSTQAMPAEKFVDMQASGQWLASDLMGLNVVGSNNESIGSVSDLLVDEDGNIHAAVVGVGGFLGIGQKNVAISFESLDIATDKNGDPQARLTLTKEELESAPDFKTAAAAKAEAQRQSSPATSPATKPVAPRNN
jgi:sporulation protein YlmC with PRC-barrel domain